MVCPKFFHDFVELPGHIHIYAMSRVFKNDNLCLGLSAFPALYFFSFPGYIKFSAPDQ